MKNDLSLAVEAFPILGRSAAAAEPGEGAFDDPALGQDDEGLGLIRPLDDLDLHPRAQNRKRRGLGKPETFSFLGFTYICGKTRRGKFLIKRKTRGDRMRAKLQEIKRELRLRMHQPIPEQGRRLKQVIAGYFNYHAVPTNSRALIAFRFHIVDLRRRTLRRRSQKDRTGWVRVGQLANDFLPKPRILHPWPQARFAVKHPRWEPYALIGPVRFCAGGAQQ